MPLTMASFALNAAVSGGNASSWRLVNVLLHLAIAAPVALLAWQLAVARARCAGSPAVVADLTFAWFAPSAKADGWVAARFDGMALFWMLAAACAFTASTSWRDRYGVTSLAATVRSLSRRQLSRVGAH